MRLNAVTGPLTVDRALQQLVAGTGLTYSYDGTGHAVTLTAAKQADIPKPAPQLKTPGPPRYAEQPEDAMKLLEEIVVTARKRTENLQDVPMSAEVISGQTLADYNIRSLTELSQSLPGIQLNGTASSGQFFIRGIGSGGNYPFDQSVGTFIDDMYHGRTRIAAEAFLDLDRVELLKGPQSTFFGNNAVAGALNIVTAKPTDAFDGSVRALYGQYGQYAGEGMLNIPLNPDLAVRIAAIGDGLSGWAKDPYARHDQPDQNNKAGRITFLYRPSDDFDATLKVEGGSSHESDGSVVGACPPPTPFATAAGPSTTSARLLSRQVIRFGCVSAIFTTQPMRDRGIDLSTFEDVLTLHYHVGEDTLTSVTGFYNYHFQENVDADGTPLQLLTLQTKEPYHQFSQELRIASPQGQTLEYLAGLYVQNDRLSGNPQTLTDRYLDSTITQAAAYAALLPYLPLATSAPYEQQEHDYAAFASFDWNVTDQLKVGAGLRGTWVYKSASSVALDGTGTATYGGFVPLPTANLQTLAGKALGTPKPAWSARNSYNSGMPSAEIDYKIVPSVMAYATYARGFLAGVPTDVGYNPPATGVSTPPILPEHVNAYEVGFKSDLFDHLRLNLDIFRSNYTDLQVASTEVDCYRYTRWRDHQCGQLAHAGCGALWRMGAQRLPVPDRGSRILDARYLSYPGAHRLTASPDVLPGPTRRFPPASRNSRTVCRPCRILAASPRNSHQHGPAA